MLLVGVSPPFVFHQKEALEDAVELLMSNPEAAAQQYGDVNAWDVSRVTDMGYMFYQASAFNQALNAWDVSSVTDMDAMFSDATAFNQALNAWDVSRVTDMEHMFKYASAFNQAMVDWDVGSVTSRQQMFRDSAITQCDFGLMKSALRLSGVPSEWVGLCPTGPTPIGRHTIGSSGGTP